jgi:hypothetical protein
VLRGGSWHNNENNARCAYRNRNNPDNSNNNIGFRVLVSHDPLNWPGISHAQGFAVEAAKESRRGLFPADGWALA